MEEERKVKARLQWVQLYQKSGNASLVCRRCGISYPTFLKWWRRYQAQGVAGLHDRSRRPKRCPPPKVLEQHREWILQLRTRRLGARRIQSELIRLYNFSLSTATIHKVLKQAGVKLLKATRRIRKGRRRYQKDTPGERVQMDVCKIGPNLYQYTAIDDCTRLKLVRLYPNKTARSTLNFVEQMVSTFPFPIQRLQTDRGEEFMALAVQNRLRELSIKFRPIKPRSPHLNGKVERTQKTDLEEFYSLVNLKSLDLPQQLQQWQDYYNRQRRHCSLNNQTPWQKWQRLAASTPTWEQVTAAYDSSKERIRCSDYLLDMAAL